VSAVTKSHCDTVKIYCLIRCDYDCASDARVTRFFLYAVLHAGPLSIAPDALSACDTLSYIA
jgi:hypothetical protein